MRAAKFLGVCAAAGAASFCMTAGVEAASVQKFQLSDHPDGNQNPPPYGLRLDNVFSANGLGNSGVTTFSFNVFGDVIMTVVDDTANSGDITISIEGTVYGGRDTGSGYGFGEGAYDLSFMFSANVQEQGTGWIVSPGDSSNFGTLTAQAGIAGVAEGTTFTFYDEANPNGNTFLVLQDDHRLGGHPGFLGMEYWVGRGWVTFNADGSSSGGTQDWLFLARPIPLPAPVALAGAGLAGVIWRRRRPA